MTTQKAERLLKAITAAGYEIVELRQSEKWRGVIDLSITPVEIEEKPKKKAR
jgi:hypothetical protein